MRIIFSAARSENRMIADGQLAQKAIILMKLKMRDWLILFGV